MTHYIFHYTKLCDELNTLNTKDNDDKSYQLIRVIQATSQFFCFPTTEKLLKNQFNKFQSFSYLHVGNFHQILFLTLRRTEKLKRQTIQMETLHARACKPGPVKLSNMKNAEKKYRIMKLRNVKPSKATQNCNWAASNWEAANDRIRPNLTLAINLPVKSFQ